MREPFPSTRRYLYRRGFLRRSVLVVVFSALITTALAVGYVTWEYSNLTRFEEAIKPTASEVTTRPTLPTVPPGVTRILVFSTGSDGLDVERDGSRLGIGRGRARMSDQLTDSLLLVTLHPDNAKIGIVSLPRDTWLEWRGHRINESFKRYGLTALVDDVETLTGLRAEHAVALNFAAFSDLTDSLGGVRLLFDAPARDAKSHLEIPSAGCVNLDGPNALAFVRSRHWQVYTNDAWRSDASSSDWGRILRQQAFIRAAAAQLLTWQLPARIPALFNVVQENVTFDQELSVSKLAGLVQGFANNKPTIETMTFPGRGGVTDTGASVIFPDMINGPESVTEFDALITGITNIYPETPNTNPSTATSSTSAVPFIPRESSSVPSPSTSTPPSSTSKILSQLRWPSC
jgi:LCP family protein required for cell wall assembly